jgi:uncharacterized protein YlxP (DUF503 family)
MHAALLQVRLHIPGARTRKDKRQVVKSILDRARHRFRVAAAEVDDQDLNQVATLGFAVVSGSAAHAREVAHKVLEALRVHPAARVTEEELDLV